MDGRTPASDVAYVLLSNHYHLLIELTEANLSRAMHWLNVSYTVWFNRLDITAYKNGAGFEQIAKDLGIPYPDKRL